MRRRGLPGFSLTSLGQTLGAVILLALVTIAVFRQTALTNLVLSEGDAFTYFYPYRAYAAQAIQGGQVPLWNPHLFLGVPFLANPQAGVFYPLNLALFWLPAPKIVTWSIVLHVAMAATFAYLYARQSMRLSMAPALLAAVAFAFGGFLSGQVEHVNQLNVSAWFPLLLLLWDLRSRAQWPAVLGMGITVGLGLLAGHTQSSYISLVGLGAYALLPALLDLWRALRKGTGRSQLRPMAMILLQLGLVALVGVALAAIQLVPTGELAQLSIRGGGLSYREAIAFSLKPLPRLLWHAFLPPWGSNLADIFGGDYYTEFLAYIGVVPLALSTTAVVWSLLRAMRNRGHALHESKTAGDGQAAAAPAGEEARVLPAARVAMLAVLGFALALGGYDPLYWVLYKVMPGFSLFRVPARWLLLYAFGAAMLAGLGLQKVQDWILYRLAKRGQRPCSLFGARLFPGSYGARARHSNKGPDTERSFAGGEARSAAMLMGMPRPYIQLRRRWPSTAVATLLVIVSLAELVVAAQALPLSHPTAPEAFSSLRTAPAHILAAQNTEMCPGRFLSMSDILFDPGDRDEIEQIFGGMLSERALYDYIVGVKRQEILAPNLPLAWRIYAVDGYDGGVLPLARYMHLQRLFLEEDQILSDGRLREGLREIPPARLLSIAGVRYVITDKVQDVWIDDVFYDLAFDAALGENAAAQVSGEVTPLFAATAVGVASYLEGGQRATDGTPVAELRLIAEDGETRTFVLQAGRDTAEGIYQAGIAHTQARVGHRWRDRPDGADYVTRLEWGKAAHIARVEVTALSFGGRMYPSAQIHIRGLTLIDARDGSNIPVVLSTEGRYRQVHSGDVKIYEVLDALPRAFVVHRAQVIADDDAAIAVMRNPSFDPGEKVILAEGREIDTVPFTKPTVTITTCDPEAVTMQAVLQAEGYLVLSDTWYPGWTATVDGQPARVERANVNSRAVYLEAGTHEVRFVYAPSSYRVGLAISAAAAVAIVAVAGAALGLAMARKRRCDRQSDSR